jgi:adenosine deaminase
MVQNQIDFAQYRWTHYILSPYCSTWSHSTDIHVLTLRRMKIDHRQKAFEKSYRHRWQNLTQIEWPKIPEVCHLVWPLRVIPQI